MGVFSFFAWTSNAMAGYLICTSQDAPARGLQVSHRYSGGDDRGIYLFVDDAAVRVEAMEAFPGGSG
jgi:hypothetical protein